MASNSKPLELRFSGGINNLNTPLDLFLRKKSEVPFLVNADVTYPGRLKPLKPLLPLNSGLGNQPLNITGVVLSNPQGVAGTYVLKYVKES